MKIEYFKVFVHAVVEMISNLVPIYTKAEKGTDIDIESLLKRMVREVLYEDSIFDIGQ